MINPDPQTQNIQKTRRQYFRNLEDLPTKITDWIGSSSSIAAHTVFFIGIFVLYFFGVPVSDILLILTTVVSLEAIYLAIFIQMTVNRNTQSLAEVEQDIDEIQEDVEEIEKDIDEIQEDVDEIQEDVEEIEKDVDEIQKDVEEMEEEDEEEDAHDAATVKTLDKIQSDMQQLMKEIEALKQQKK